jgi:hypothetical protein
MTDLLTQHENESIRAFVQSAADDGYLSGRVLDYGCGRQPYRDIVRRAGGEYVGYDHASFPAHIGTTSVPTNPWHNTGEHFDAILCNQVLQYVRFYRDERYVPDMTIASLLDRFRFHAKILVMTYPTNWPEVEVEDLHRFTKAGMEMLLTEAGFTILRHEPRAWFDPWGGFITGNTHVPPDALAFGYGVVARA